MIDNFLRILDSILGSFCHVISTSTDIKKEMLNVLYPSLQILQNIFLSLKDSFLYNSHQDLFSWRQGLLNESYTHNYTLLTFVSQVLVSFEISWILLKHHLCIFEQSFSTGCWDLFKKLSIMMINSDTVAYFLLVCKILAPQQLTFDPKIKHIHYTIKCLLLSVAVSG